MQTKEEMITITKAEYDDLRDAALFLDCLEDAGVDNWGGYSYARDDYRRIKEGDESDEI